MMQATPPNIHSIFANEILSAIPIRPIVVVSNKIIGPIKARATINNECLFNVIVFDE